MRGKQILMESLLGHGVEYIFGNPGTTESPILDALLDYTQLRYVVALHEGVALGAASYYAQTSGKPAVVNIHVAPGLGNALAIGLFVVMTMCITAYTLLQRRASRWLRC